MGGLMDPQSFSTLHFPSDHFPSPFVSSLPNLSFPFLPFFFFLTHSIIPLPPSLFHLLSLSFFPLYFLSSLPFSPLHAVSSHPSHHCPSPHSPVTHSHSLILHFPPSLPPFPPYPLREAVVVNTSGAFVVAVKLEIKAK